MLNSTEQCRFCNKTKQKIIYSSELFFVVRDSYPVTKHHTLIIPNRHVSDFFDLNDNELNDLNKIITNTIIPQRAIFLNNIFAFVLLARNAGATKINTAIK